MGKKRIIIVGPSASGKNILRSRLADRGYTFDVSYTTREIRKDNNEVDGVDYNFISDKEFDRMLSNGELYENVEYNGYKYGTGLHEWNTRDVFIMEPDGIGCITKEDRKDCFIIYLNVDLTVRVDRMRTERKWREDKIMERVMTDIKKFSNFADYDITIANPDF